MGAIKNLGISGAFALLVWLGYVQGIDGARNVAAFITWLVFLPAATLGAAALTSDAVRNKIRPTVKPDHAGPVIRWTNTVLLLACTATMVWHGAIGTGATLFIAWVCATYTTRTLLQLRAERAVQERGEAA